MARKPRRKPALAIKAAADRAEATSKGEELTEPTVPLDPVVIKATEIAKAAKVGRPALFKPEMVDQAERLCALGLTDEELAQFFKINVRTLYKWKGKYPEFGQAIKTAGAPADERVERSLYKRAVGYQQDAVKIFMPAGADEPVIVPYKEQIAPDTTAAIFWLKNRRSDAWRDSNRLDLNYQISLSAEFESFIRQLGAGQAVKVIDATAIAPAE